MMATQRDPAGHDSPGGDPQLQLLTALMQGDNETFHELLQQSTVNPNHRYRHLQGSTCTHIASRRGNHVALSLLAKDGRPQVNTADQYGRTALHLAAKYFGSIKNQTEDYERCIKILIKWPQIDVNKLNKKGFTAIYEAALAGKKEALQALLKYGQDKIDVDKLQGDGSSARDLIIKKYPDIATVLSSLNSDLSRYDPYLQLLDLFKNQQFEHFQALLYSIDSEGNMKLDPNHFYHAPYNATLLEIACRQDGTQYRDYVLLLLNAGADPNIINPITNQTPLHLAAQLANLSILEILTASSNTYINLLDEEGKTALHVLAEKTANLKFEKDRVNQCMLLLLKNKKLDVNICDCNGLPAILAAAERANKMVVDIMIENCLNKLDFDKILSNQMFSDLVKKCPQLKVLTERKKKHFQPRTCGDMKEQIFQHLYSRDINSFKKLFLEQVQKGTHKSILNTTEGSHTLLQYAARYGLSEVTQLLLSHGANPNAIHPRNSKCPLILACIHRHHEILDLLLKPVRETRLNINATDMKGNTALYYAAWNRDLQCVVTLLRHGATLDHRNIYGNLPITCSAMESLLDQCVTSSGHPEDDDYRLEFDYNLLLAYRKNPKPAFEESVISIKGLFDDYHNLRTDNQTGEGTLLKNTDPEAHNTKQIASRRMTEGSEMEFLHYISISEDYSSLLTHPVIRSFLHIKWSHITKAYYANLFLFILYMILLNTYILMSVKPSETLHNTDINSSQVQDAQSVSNPGYNLTLKILVTIIVSCLAIRELCQCIGSTKYYIKNPENYLDIGTIVTTIVALHYDSSENKLEETLTVVAIILSWLELVLITGRHPFLSRNIAMLKAVSKNYFWFFLTYSFLIVAFALSFYSLFHDNSNIFFHEPGTSIFKTIIMMNGEYDTSSFEFNMADTTTYLVYIIFVLFIGIVLNNLLTGLAVSDTQSIIQKAEQLSLSSRIKLIYEIERVFITWSQFLKKVCPSILMNITNKLEKNVNIFQHKELYILPNKYGKIMLGNNDLDTSKIKLDLDILCAAIKILSKKGDISEFDRINLNLEDIIIEQKKIFELQQASLLKLQTHIDNNTVKADQNQRNISKLHNKLNSIKEKVDEGRFQTEENNKELKKISERLNSIEHGDANDQSNTFRSVQDGGNLETEASYIDINNKIQAQIQQHDAKLDKILMSYTETQEILQGILQKLSDN